MKRLILMVLVLTCATLIAADPVRIGVLRGPTALAFAPAISQSAENDELSFEVFPTPDVLIARMISGEIDAATLPSNVAAQLYNRDLDIQVVATFLWGVLYLVGPGLADSLPGIDVEEILVPGRGATPDLVTRYLLNSAGVASQPRYGLSPVEISQLLIAGRAEAGVLPEPFVTRTLAASPELSVIDLQREWAGAAGTDLPQTVLVTIGETSREGHTQLLALLESSVAEVMDDPALAFANVETLGLGLDAATAEAALPRLNLRVETGSSSRAAIEAYFRVLTGFVPEAIAGPLPGAEFYGF